MGRYCIYILVSLLSFFSSADGLANSIMSIDLGNEYLKFALVKPGVPMETVLNRESQRKTPLALTIKNGERFFGSQALKKAIAVPQFTYTYFLNLIGKPFNNTFVEAFQREFPYLVLKQNEKRETVDFVTDSGDIPIETLLGMVLSNARTEVEAYAGQPVKGAVISVPPFFGLPERQAVETAAKIAGLNLLTQLSAGAAAGLNYGVFRQKEFTEQPQTLLVYDVGSVKTAATIVQYRLVNETKEGAKEPITFPLEEVIGVGFDPALGGHHLTLRLRERLVEAFKKQHPSATGLESSPQALAKLLKEADRVKQVLSANSVTFAQVESLYQDLDFRVKIARSEMEEIFHDFEKLYLLPIGESLRSAQLTLDKLDRVVLMGGGTRIPRLLEALVQYLEGKQIGRNLNTDEAIALGAVYHAARESKHFRVKRFDVADYQLPTEEGQTLQQMDEESIAQAKKLLSDFESREKAIVERADALNSLESSVYDYSSKMEEEEFRKYGNAEEIDLISKLISELKEWLEDIPEEVGAEKLREKKRELYKPIRKLKNRKKQKEERPELLKKLQEKVEEADKQLELFQNKKDILSEQEITAFVELLISTKTWLESVKKEIEGLQDNQDATFSTDDFKSKTNMLNREIKFLSNKILIKQMEEAAKKAEEEAKKKAEEAKRKAEELAAKKAEEEKEAEEVKKAEEDEGEQIVAMEEGQDEGEKIVAVEEGQLENETKEEQIVVAELPAGNVTTNGTVTVETIVVEELPSARPTNETIKDAKEEL